MKNNLNNDLNKLISSSIEEKKLIENIDENLSKLIDIDIESIELVSANEVSFLDFVSNLE